MKKFDFTRTQIIFAMLSVAVMVAIFLFSCENASESDQTSGVFSNFLLHLLYPDYDSFSAARQEELHGILNHFIRKAAHFTIYASLGFCASFTAGKRRLLSFGSLAVAGVCFLYACSDEIHQYFVPGRACMFTDVLLDTCGGITGLLVSMAVMAIICRKFRVQS